MRTTIFETRLFGTNIYLLWNNDGGEAIIVDPGMMSDEERDRVTEFVDRHSLKVTHILLTHGHVDHITGANILARRYGVGIEGCEKDQFLINTLDAQIKHFNLRIRDAEPFQLGNHLSHGSVITLEDEQIQVLEVPGHSPGSLVFYAPQSGFVITGDTLFSGSIGRTDLPGGDYTTLIKAITENLMTLPDDTIVYPGHGPSTTINAEKRNNPYL